MNILILNGPNLNLLGVREPDTYGDQAFDDYLTKLKDRFSFLSIEYFQSNVEGELINKIHEYGFSDYGIVLNAGAYTHTSVALADAISA
ncbi:MAG: type II 3-dehydroquinate dehydratase, partial [Marinilabiliaceae bacterium]